MSSVLGEFTLITPFFFKNKLRTLLYVVFFNFVFLFCFLFTKPRYHKQLTALVERCRASAREQEARQRASDSSLHLQSLDVLLLQSAVRVVLVQ